MAGPGCLDDAIHLRSSKLVGAAAGRFFAQFFQYLWLRGGQANVVLNAQQDSLRATALLNDEAAVPLVYFLQNLAELAACGQR